jgi:hypothetical protein
MAHKQSQKSSATHAADTPKQGEIYHCSQCGMELKITTWTAPSYSPWLCLNALSVSAWGKLL